MRISLRGAGQIAVLCALVSLGCGSDSESEDPGTNCDTTVDSITSPSAGFATLHGEFFHDETVIIEETDGTVISQGTPDSDRNAFTLGGVPSGHHHYEIVVSCDNGQENLGGFDVDID
jgi:hypothetical protein